jgi:hypothetical protein
MEDFDALAAALGAGVTDLRGCLILSRDGLVLGSHPAAAEADLKQSWGRFAALGEPERGFVQFGSETWSYARRGPYGSFAVTGPRVRPGLVIDHIEQVLLAAEQARSRPQPVPPVPSSTPEVVKRKKRPAPRGEPRTAEGADPFEQPLVIDVEPVEAVTPAGEDALEAANLQPVEAVADPPDTGGRDAPDGAPEDAPADAPRRAETAAAEREPSDRDDDEVDRFSLAREFSQLLQDDGNPADG